jgi:hypothetical protein
MVITISAGNRPVGKPINRWEDAVKEDSASL